MNDRMLDAMTVISFIIGLANYEENADQNQLQDVAQAIINDIHEHLHEQDKKIEEILKIVREGK